MINFLSILQSLDTGCLTFLGSTLARYGLTSTVIPARVTGLVGVLLRSGSQREVTLGCILEAGIASQVSAIELAALKFVKFFEWFRRRIVCLSQSTQMLFSTVRISCPAFCETPL